MGSYALYDFTESLDRAKIRKEDVARVVAAWGTWEDDHQSWSEWEGGFLMEMRDGRTAYLWGWCDSSGWGCQDGSEMKYVDDPADRTILRGMPQHMGGYIEALSGGDPSKWEHDWDEDPIDLNRWLRGETSVE